MTIYLQRSASIQPRTSLGKSDVVRAQTVAPAFGGSRLLRYWAERKITAPPVYTAHVNHLMSDYIEQSLRGDDLDAKLKCAAALYFFRS